MGGGDHDHSPSDGYHFDSWKRDSHRCFIDLLHGIGGRSRHTGNKSRAEQSCREESFSIRLFYIGNLFIIDGIKMSKSGDDSCKGVFSYTVDSDS